MECWPPQDDYWHAVEALGRKRFPEHYAGLALVPGGIEVYRKACEDFDREARGLRAGVQLTFRDVAHSARELMAVVERIGADLEHWRAKGVALHSWGPRPELGAVEVMTTDPHAARRLLPLRYGIAPPIIVVGGGPVVGL